MRHWFVGLCLLCVALSQTSGEEEFTFDFSEVEPIAAKMREESENAYKEMFSELTGFNEEKKLLISSLDEVRGHAEETCREAAAVRDKILAELDAFHMELSGMQPVEARLNEAKSERERMQSQLTSDLEVFREELSELASVRGELEEARNESQGVRSRIDSEFEEFNKDEQLLLASLSAARHRLDKSLQEVEGTKSGVESGLNTFEAEVEDPVHHRFTAADGLTDPVYLHPETLQPV